ncbi:MAG: sulfatase-like hydrolase/transferase [Pirellulales bacterium]
MSLRGQRHLFYKDKPVGNLIDAIDNTGLERNTLIIFTGNNGSAVTGNLKVKPLEMGKGRVRQING